MPLSARASVLADSMVWDVPSGGPVGDGAPGSWGGHAVPILGFSPNGSGDFQYFAPSWDGLYTITAAFMAAYADEAYASSGGQRLVTDGVRAQRFLRQRNYWPIWRQYHNWPMRVREPTCKSVHSPGVR